MFSSQTGFLVITGWLSAAIVTILSLVHLQEERRKGTGRKNGTEEEREQNWGRTVLPSTVSCSLVLLGPLKYCPTRTNNCSQGNSELCGLKPGPWLTLAESLGLPWWPRPGTANLFLPAKSSQPPCNYGPRGKNGFYHFKWLYKNLNKIFKFASWPTKSKRFSTWHCVKKFANV